MLGMAACLIGNMSVDWMNSGWMFFRVFSILLIVVGLCLAIPDIRGFLQKNGEPADAEKRPEDNK